MYSFTLNRKPYKIPSLASELTLGQFIAIRALKPDDELGMLSALMGEPVTPNIQTEAEIKDFEIELSRVFKLVEQFEADLSKCLQSGILLVTPKRIEIEGLDIPIVENFVRSLPYWGFVHTREVIMSKQGKNREFDATDDIAGILAHNLYSLVTKSAYNEAKAEEFKDVMYGVSFIHAMQLGNFFLIQQKRLWTSRRKRWIMRLNLWRLRLVYLFSANTARSIPSKLYQEGIFSYGNK